jgi:hypothetical protein
MNAGSDERYYGDRKEHPYWVHIEEGRRHLGAGVLITRGFVLTALHCLRTLSATDARVDLILPDERRVTGRVCDSIKEADLALIAVENAHAHGLPPAPPADWPRPQVRWKGSYRPPREHTRLSGTVTHAPIRYRNAAGGEFVGLELVVDQLLGDFSGYSGSPVNAEPHETGEPRASGERPWRVVGILMEQELGRADSSGCNVLYAASLRHAMDLFPHFDVARLVKEATGVPLSIPEPISPSAEESDGKAQVGLLGPTADADAILKALRQWEEGGEITAREAADHRGRVLRKLGDQLLGGDRGE